MEYFYTATYGDCTDYGWVSYCDYFTRIGVCRHEPFTRYMTLLKEANPMFMIQLKGVCFVSKPPVKVNRDNRGNLHSTTGCAVEFADGYGQHYLWGVYFPPEMFQKYITSKASAKEIFVIENQEQKAAIIKHIGYENLINDLPNIRVVGELVKQGKNHVLYSFQLTHQVQPRFLMVEDFSTDRRYFLGVPRNCDTVLEALAWTFQIEPEVYASLTVET